MSKHTKGEWGMVLVNDTTYLSTPGDRQPFAKVIHNEASVNETAANAKLIAAAPDLLEALTDLYNTVAIEMEMPLLITMHKKVEDAIEKATS